MKNLENLLSELEFLNTEILTKIEKLNLNEIKKLNEKLEKIDFDKEFFENLKKESEKIRAEQLKILKEDVDLMRKLKDEIEYEKTYLINVIEEIKDSLKEVKKNTRLMSKVNITIVIIAAAAGAAAGFLWQVFNLVVTTK